MHTFRRILFIIGSCFLLTVPAFGYVPEGELLLFLMTEKIGQPQGLMVKQAVSQDLLPCGEENEYPERLRETVWYRPPGDFRSEIRGDGGKNLYVASAGEVVTIFQQAIFSMEENRLMLYKEPLLFRDWKTLSERLSILGVDVAVSSLGRMEGKVAFVIGAQYPDDSRSQFWLRKDTLLPWRLIIHQPGAESIEAVYSDWRNQGSFLHPRRIEVYQNNILHRVICCEKVAAHAFFADNFFDIEYLQSRYPLSGEASIETKEKPHDEVQQTIDAFRKLYQ